MSNFSRFSPSQDFKTAPPSGRMAFILFGAGLCLAFGLGQLHLQFALNDLKRETGKLQARRMELHAEINSLKSEVEEQKQGDKLLRYAEAELGMVQAPTKADTMAIASDIRSRYSGSGPRKAPVPAEELNKTADTLAARAATLEGKAVAQSANR